MRPFVFGLLGNGFEPEPTMTPREWVDKYVDKDLLRKIVEASVDDMKKLDTDIYMFDTVAPGWMGVHSYEVVAEEFRFLNPKNVTADNFDELEEYGKEIARIFTDITRDILPQNCVIDFITNQYGDIGFAIVCEVM